MSYLDTHRFDHLSEAEVISRIGDLLALAIIRSGRLETNPQGLQPDFKLLQQTKTTPGPVEQGGDLLTAHPHGDHPSDETGAMEIKAA
ncbi:hypothetical protein OPIT5_22055 [Opitutaceae bacterium TAV5]|nr:hypothetical protein OPIT5_22055 [Opitutaceae bacterium TAV5]